MALGWSSSQSVLLIFLVRASFAILSSNSTDEVLDVRITRPDDVEDVDGKINGGSDKCLVQLYSSLEKLRRRQVTSNKVTSLIDLSGYALHQPLRNAPVDMYVTDIKVKAPSLGSWVQVQRCQFSRNAEMSTQLLFSDLLVSGVVKLLPGDVPLHTPLSQPQQTCTMTVRLRRAGLDLKAAPTFAGLKTEERGRGIQVRTESNFVEPNFLSVHAYGCRLDQWAKEDGVPLFENFSPTSIEDQGRSSRSESDQPQIRIISLGEAPELDNDGRNELHRVHLPLATSANNDKMAGILKVKDAITQQANAVFQVHGPFSQRPSQSTIPKPLFTPHHHVTRPKPTSTITELDEALRPIRPVPQKPFESIVAATNQPPNQPLFTNQPPNQPLFTNQPTGLQDVASEMEEVFLRGTKILLSKYLEKQLEVPIKEALMTKIGYTVSYG